MALTNSQYNSIIRGYEAAQNRNHQLHMERRDEVYREIPSYEALEQEISTCSVACGKRLLEGDSSALTELKEKLASLRAQKSALLAAHHFPSDYLEPIYDCPDCKDTGYIDGQKCHCFKQQMSRFIDFSDGKALMVNNADWLMDLNYIDVLREVGAHFSVNRMLTAECYKQRMEKGLSFLEFNYMIMQSYDFYTLYQKYGCNMEFGGDDQWSNMLGGTELIRRKLGKDAYAMTINLLLNSEGKKMGKTQSGAVWLDPNKTSPFDFFQYWRNVSDADVLKCIRMLTFLPLEEIDAMESWEGAQLNQAKEILAFELTKLVHGEEEANKAKEASHALFAGGGDSAHMPTLELTAADFADGDLDILALLVKAELAPSRSDARRAVQQGGVSVADEKVTDIQTTYGADAFGADGLVVKRGKKKFVKIVVK